MSGAREGQGAPQQEPKRQKQKQGAAAPAPAVAAQPPPPLPPGGLLLDGSLLEGGGQLLRNASALAVITRTPIKVEKIRAGRDRPGLRPQHLTGLQLIAALSGGQLQGGAVGSSCIALDPGELRAGSHVGDTKTAGSCMLLAQSALPCMLYAAAPAAPEVAEVAEAADAAAALPQVQDGSSPAPTAKAAAVTPATVPAAAVPAAAVAAVSHLELRGGTDAAMAPPVGYLQEVLLPTLRRQLGIEAEMRLVQRGFYPRGGGEVQLDVHALPQGAALPPIQLTQRGEVTRISLHAFTAGKINPSIGQRMAAAAERALAARLGEFGMAPGAPGVQVEVTHEPPERALGDGCGLLLVAETSGGCLLGASGLGKRGVSAEAVGERAARELADALSSGACVDEWLQDQLVIFMALAEGRSRVLSGEPTLHTRTAILVAETVTGARFRLVQQGQQQGKDKLWLLECEGAGMRRGTGAGSGGSAAAVG